MLASLIAIATVANLGAGTMMTEPTAFEQPVRMAPIHSQTQASGHANLAGIPLTAGVGKQSQPNPRAVVTRRAANPDYVQEPESIARGTEP